MFREIAGALVVLSCASTALVAQVEKGDVELGFSGSLGWARSTSPGFPDSENWGVNGSVAAGFFISDRVDIGGRFGAGYSDYDDGHGYSFTLGPAADYHFRPASDIVPFVGGGAGYFRRESEYSGGAATSTTTGWYAEVGGGADFFLNSFVSIKLLMQYNHSDGDVKYRDLIVEQDVSSETDNVSMIVGFAFFFK